MTVQTKSVHDSPALFGGNSFRKNVQPPPLPLLEPKERNAFVRLLTARVLAQYQRTSVESVVEKCWPSDLVLRAAVAPAMTQVAGWAAEIAHRLVYDQLDAMAPTSAGAKLLKLGTVLVMDGLGSIVVPGFLAAAANSSFVAEGAPIPVRQLTDTSVTLQPYKLATIAVLSREMLESSNAEVLIGDALVKSTSVALDFVMFDGNPAIPSTRPAGLLNGVAQTPPAAAGTDAWISSFADFSSLAGAVSSVSGANPIIAVAGPSKAVSMGLRLFGQIEPNILRSSALVGNIVAVAPIALVSALSPTPDIEVTNAGTLVMDSAAGVVESGGALRSLFQTDSFAIKIRWPITWALRSPAAVAWTTQTWQ